MPGEVFIYLGSACGAFFYIIEFYTARENYKKLYIPESKKDNKIINYYSMQLRVCNIVYDFSMLNFNYINELQSAVIVFSVYLCIDFIILFIRLYYHYILHFKVMNVIIDSIENPLHGSYS